MRAYASLVLCRRGLQRRAVRDRPVPAEAPQGHEELPRQGDDHHLAGAPARGLRTTPKPCGELAQQFDVHPNQITAWKALLLEGAAGVFGAEARTMPGAPPPVDVKTLHAKIGELTLANDFLEGALSKAGLLSARR